MFRRFDDVIEYKNPNREQIVRLLKMKLSGRAADEIFSDDVYKMALELNHADIVKACEDAVKYSILEESVITKDIMINYLQDRKDRYRYKEA